MYRLTSDMMLHEASDGSGVIVYSDYSGELLRFPVQLVSLLKHWSAEEVVSAQSIRDSLQECLPEYADQVYDLLIAKQFFIETQHAPV